MSPARKATKRKRRAAPKPPKGAPVQVLSASRKAYLGTKHACFGCGAKFYDLNRPEPICPKCGANQNERPKEEATPRPPPPEPERKPKPSPMAPLLEEDDDVGSTAGDADVDLDLGAIDDDEDDLFDGGDSVEISDDDEDS